MQKLPVSLCMIVKNEEYTLRRCLESVKNWVNEIIIVDTGSSDSTIEIARDYTCLVETYEWNNHFAQARNASLALASNPWILQLDADEFLEQDSVSWFYQTYPWAGKKGYQVPILNTRSNRMDDVFISHKAIRFFRNHAQIKYKNAIHEAVKIEPDYLGTSKARIIHTGYADENKREQRIRRNKKLLEQELRENPDDPFWHANMMLFYSTKQEYKEAAEYAKTALQLGMQNPLRRHCLRNIMEYALRSRQKSLFDEAVQKTDSNELPEVLYYKALFHLYSKKKKAAIALLKAFIEQIEALPRQLASERIQTDNISNAYVQLSKLLTTEYNASDKVNLLKKALIWTPSRLRLHITLAEAYLENREIEKAISKYQFIRSELEQKNTEKHMALMAQIDTLLDKLRAEIQAFE